MTDIGKLIDDAFPEVHSDLDSKRPYDGQPWTNAGERGKALVGGLTMRDIVDCFARAVFKSSGPGPLYEASCKGDGCLLSMNDLYDVDLSDIDIVAVSQDLTCEIERMMGIFPNIYKDAFEDHPTIKAIKEPRRD